MRVFVEPNKNFTEEIKYVFQTLAHNYHINIEFVASASDSDVSAGSSAGFTFRIAENFYNDISVNKKFSHLHHFQDDCVITDGQGEIDYLSTIFYMLNSIQEHGELEYDEIGRFKYSNSYQSRFKNIEDNLVGKFAKQVFPDLKEPKSKIFLSHDIDSINGSVVQDSFYLLKKGNPLPVFKLVMNAALQRPDWLNMDKIMKIEDEYSLRSAFFWLVNKGRINEREVNSDYDINSSKIRKTLKSVEDKGWENGLHKSISPDSYKEEIGKLGLPVIANRNHYLKFKLPDLYKNIEASGLQLDASIGFAEAVGFRNSYGLPFHPFDLEQRKRYSFVEVPLTVMDGTLKQYRGVPLKDTSAQIISFLEKNKVGSLISVLWHNTYFTDYKFAGYVKVYRQILEYIRDNDLQGINPRGIVKEFAWKI